MRVTTYRDDRRLISWCGECWWTGPLAQAQEIVRRLPMRVGQRLVQPQVDVREALHRAFPGLATSQPAGLGLDVRDLWYRSEWRPWTERAEERAAQLEIPADVGPDPLVDVRQAIVRALGPDVVLTDTRWGLHVRLGDLADEIPRGTSPQEAHDLLTDHALRVLGWGSLEPPGLERGEMLEI